MATELWSALPREACVRRLAAAVDSPWKWSGTQAVIGSVNANAAKLRWRIVYRNSFQTIMTIALSDQAGGTLLRCSFRINAAVIVFMAFWFGFFLLTSVPQLVASGFFTNASTPVNWSDLAFSAGFLVFGVALVGVCRYLARNEQANLTRFVCDTIQAQAVTR